MLLEDCLYWDHVRWRMILWMVGRWFASLFEWMDGCMDGCVYVYVFGYNVFGI